MKQKLVRWSKWATMVSAIVGAGLLLSGLLPIRIEGKWVTPEQAERSQTDTDAKLDRMDGRIDGLERSIERIDATSRKTLEAILEHVRH